MKTGSPWSKPRIDLGGNRTAIVKKLQRRSNSGRELTTNSFIPSSYEKCIAYSENFIFLGDLGGGHREYELPLKLLTGNDRKSKPWSPPKRRFRAGKPIRRISSSKRGSERRESNPERSRMLGLNRSSYALSSQCMAWSLSPMDA